MAPHQHYNKTMLKQMTFLKDLLYHSVLSVTSVLDQVDLADTAHKEQLNSSHENSQELALTAPGLRCCQSGQAKPF